MFPGQELIVSVGKIGARKLKAAEINRLAEHAVKDFSSVSGLVKIVLFGSASRKTMTEASDLDILLLFKDQASSRAASRKIGSYRKNLKWPSDILCVDEERFEIQSQIGGVLFVAREEGKVIFERP